MIEDQSKEALEVDFANWYIRGSALVGVVFRFALQNFERIYTSLNSSSLRRLSYILSVVPPDYVFFYALITLMVKL